MKIKKSVFEQIIKEEALKVKKLIALKEEKAKITHKLNELYEEDDCVTESESILDLIPDPNDKQKVQQDIQAQSQQQPQQLEESIGSGILNKIKDVLFSKVKTQNPEGFEQLAQDVKSKYAGKSFKDIYNTLKPSIQGVFNEESRKSSAKMNLKTGVLKGVNKSSAVLGISSGSASVLLFAASLVLSSIQGHGGGLPTTLGQYALGLIATAVVSGIVYILSKHELDKMSKK